MDGDRWIEEAKEQLLMLKVKLVHDETLDFDTRHEIFDHIAAIRKLLGGNYKKPIKVHFTGGGCD